MTKICPSSKKCIKSIKKFLRKNDENKKATLRPDIPAQSVVLLFFTVLWTGNPEVSDPADAQRSLSDCSPP